MSCAALSHELSYPTSVHEQAQNSQGTLTEGEGSVQLTSLLR